MHGPHGLPSQVTIWSYSNGFIFISGAITLKPKDNFWKTFWKKKQKKQKQWKKYSLRKNKIPNLLTLDQILQQLLSLTFFLIICLNFPAFYIQEKYLPTLWENRKNASEVFSSIIYLNSMSVTFWYIFTADTFEWQIFTFNDREWWHWCLLLCAVSQWHLSLLRHLIDE